MSLGENLIEEFEREMDKLNEEQACAGMLGLDQEVPSTRPADYFNAEIKTEEEPMYIQPPYIHLAITDEALSTSSANTNIPASVHEASNSFNTRSGWQVPFIASTNANSFTFSTSDSKDSLNTPTPFCSNAVTGLKWETSVMSSAQSPFLTSSASSVSLPASSTTDASSSLFLSSSPSSLPLSSSTPSSVSSRLPTPLHEQSFLCSDASLSSSPSSSSSFSSSDARLDLTPPPSLGSSSSSSLSSSLSSPPPSFLQDLGFATVTPVSTTRTSTYITNGLAGSGCTIVSNVVNFLNDPPQQALNDAGKEYTDLDKQPFSFYDGLGDINMDVKPLDKLNGYNNEIIINNKNNAASLMQEDPDLLQSLQMMHEALQKDCEELNIPFDPMMWTAEHVRLWVSSLCQKNNLPDISQQLYPITGPMLYSLSDSALQQYGESGSRISLEIACCRAAKSVILQETLPQTIPCGPGLAGTGVASSFQQQQQTYLSSPCGSPALSTGSTGQASSTGFSTPSDHSDDETVSSSVNHGTHKIKSQYKPKKTRGGRSILLWQFLKELLMSDDPSHADCIRWLDRQRGIFKIEDSKKVAFLWGQRKDHHKMNYDKLSRSIRQYYKKGIIQKTEQSRRLVYQFCHK